MTPEQLIKHALWLAGSKPPAESTDLTRSWASNVVRVLKDLAANAAQQRGLAEQAEPDDPNYPFYELKFIMRVLGHEGRAPREDWQTACGMARAIFTRWHSEKIASPPAPQEAQADDEAVELLRWYDEEGGFNQGTKAPHKWVLRAEQALRRLATPVAQPATEQAEAPSQAIHQHGFAAANNHLRTINESLDKQLEEVMAERDERDDVLVRIADLIDAEFTSAYGFADLERDLEERLHVAAQPTASNAGERELDLYDEIECDLLSLFGRASIEGHESGQRLARQVRTKMQAARAALASKPVAPPAREAESSYQLVGEVQTLHELNDSWIQHLPAGTPLYAKTRTNVGSDGLSDEDRAAMRFRLDEWASSPPSDLACAWMPIESAPKDGTTLLLRSRKGRVADGCWVPVNGDKGYWAWALVNQEPAEWAPMLSATTPAPAGQIDALRELFALHAAEVENNPYAYCEVAYTRATGWMAWITDKPLACVVESPDRKVLLRGQGDTPEEAAAAALRAARGDEVNQK